MLCRFINFLPLLSHISIFHKIASQNCSTAGDAAINQGVISHQSPIIAKSCLSNWHYIKYSWLGVRTYNGAPYVANRSIIYGFKFVAAVVH